MKKNSSREKKGDPQFASRIGGTKIYWDGKWERTEQSVCFLQTLLGLGQFFCGKKTQINAFFDTHELGALCLSPYHWGTSQHGSQPTHNPWTHNFFFFAFGFPPPPFHARSRHSYNNEGQDPLQDTPPQSSERPKTSPTSSQQKWEWKSERVRHRDRLASHPAPLATFDTHDSRGDDYK